MGTKRNSILAMAAQWILAIAFCLSAMNSFAKENCGPTVQTFWNLDFQKHQIKLLESFHHPSNRICLSDSGGNTNATIELLSGQGNIEATQRISLERRFNSDTLAPNGKALRGRSQILDHLEIQLKFIDNESYSKAKSIRIKVDDGTELGPEKFK